MKYHRLVSPLLSPSSHSHSLRLLRSKIAFFSSFSSSSSTRLYQIPELHLPTNQSWSRTTFAQESTASVQEMKKPIPTPTPTQRVSEIVEEIAHLNLIEVSQLFNYLIEKQGRTVDDMPIMFMMMPGMSIGGGKSSAKGSGGASVVEEKKEKTAFDLKLEGFEANAKIKIIKEVRTFTDLGLKEAKELVEKAPTLLKKGVPKEEAQKIIDKMKEIGAKVVME